MFALESQMLTPVLTWVNDHGLLAKGEYETPWGICDVVGCKIDAERAQLRRSLGQRQSVGSLFRMNLLSKIPDVEQASVTFDELREEVGDLIDTNELVRHVAVLKGRKFVVEEDGRLAKVNGWMPLHSRVVSVEMKLKRFSEVIAQARANLSLTPDSYIAIPEPDALRLVAKKESELKDIGVGVLAVNPYRAYEALAPVSPSQRNNTYSAHCAERFWPRYLRGNSA